jgi:hypothetical protein
MLVTTKGCRWSSLLDVLEAELESSVSLSQWPSFQSLTLSRAFRFLIISFFLHIKETNQLYFSDLEAVQFPSDRLYREGLHFTLHHTLPESSNS